MFFVNHLARRFYYLEMAPAFFITPVHSLTPDANYSYARLEPGKLGSDEYRPLSMLGGGLSAPAMDAQPRPPRRAAFRAMAWSNVPGAEWILRGKHRRVIGEVELATLYRIEEYARMAENAHRGLETGRRRADT